MVSPRQAWAVYRRHVSFKKKQRLLSDEYFTTTVIAGHNGPCSLPFGSQRVLQPSACAPCPGSNGVTQPDAAEEGTSPLQEGRSPWCPQH
jgi:hypothetical protein